MDGRMDGWLFVWTDDWIKGCLVVEIIHWLDGGLKKCPFLLMHGNEEVKHTGGGVDECMDGRIEDRMKVLTAGWSNRLLE